MENNFERLLKRVSPTLKRITYRLNGHFPFFNDEDLYQEALIRLWSDFQAGLLNDKTDSYILQGCYFHLKNFIRTHSDKAKLISMHALLNQEDSLQLKETAYFLDKRPYFEEMQADILVREIMNNGLSKREKAIFSYLLEGLTTREIGDKLGISHVYVVKLKKHLRSKLRSYL